MCRMLYIETETPRKSALKLARFALRYWFPRNNDGCGLSVQKKDGNIVVAKGLFSPKLLFKHESSLTRRFAGHVRAGTHGTRERKNAHPFVTCDGRSTFMHNGVVFGYSNLKQRLIKNGHKFTSDTDSEVLMHLGEEVGPEKLTETLNKEKVTGYANWIWMTPKKTFAFSDGSLWLVRDEMGMQVALFSDLEWAEKGFFNKPQHLPSGTLVIIENGKHTKKNTDTINGGPYYDITQATNTRWKTKNNNAYRGAIREWYDDNDDGWRHWYASETRSDYTVRDIVSDTEAASAPSKSEVSGEPRRIMEAEWFAPGDLFCKKCNVVYSDPTPTGRCSICYSELLTVSDLV